MSNLWELIINMLEGLLFFLLLNLKLERKEMDFFIIKQGAVLLVQSVLLYIFNQLNISPLFILLGFTIFHFIVSHVFFSSSNILKIFWVIIYTVATVIADALTTIIPTKILDFSIEELLLGGALRVPFTLVYISLLTIIIIILLCFTTKTFRLSLLEKSVFIVLSVICISIEELIILEQVTIYHSKAAQASNLIYAIFFLVMFVFVTLIFYVYTLGIEKEKNLKILELHMISEIENKQYSQIIQSVSELRIMKHDLSNHLKTIQTMLKNESYEEVNNYILSLSGSLEQSYYAISSGNIPVDCIVTNKLDQAKQESISVDYTIHLPNNFPLSDIEACSLIGNLFDNAIESCNKLEQDERIIKFFIRPYNKMLSIQMFNSSNGDYSCDATGTLITTKNNTEKHLHGMGLKRIYDIVSAHKGFWEIAPNETSFQISILIPLETTEENIIQN